MESVLNNSFNENKLEELLIANWSHFLDSSKLLAFVIQYTKANINNFDIIKVKEIKSKGVKISISRFYLTSNGFNLWVEFNVPSSSNQMVEGTTELNISHNGNITHVNTTGNLYSCF